MKSSPSFAMRCGRAALAGALALGLAACSARAADSAPIRVLTVAHPEPAAFRENLKMMVQACQLALKLPVVELPVPSVAELERFELLQREQLFDGRAWAEYTTQRELTPDPRSGCRLALFSLRSVTIEHACESVVKGTNGLTQMQLVDFEHPVTQGAPKLHENTLGAENCRQKPSDIDLAALPKEDAGAGVQCVWVQDILRQKLARTKYFADAARKPSNPDATDFCLYAKRPYYDLGGVRKQVTLKMRGSTRSRAGNDLQQVVGELGFIHRNELKSFNEGAAIPAERFTRAAAEAFLSQPIKSSPGGS